MFASLMLVALTVAADGTQGCPQHARHTAVPAARSPYAGEEGRAIKALSHSDIKAYLEGAGLGMAKPAELNQYPGPRHVLDAADALKLNDAQRAAIEASFREMKAEAMTLGQRVVEAERRLDALFAERKASPASVSQLTHEVGELQGQLRAVHLRAHLTVRAQLAPEQIQQYLVLRGYADGGRGTGHQH